MKIEKCFLQDMDPLQAGIRCRYPVDQVDWVWHPTLDANESAIVRFSLSFDVLPEDPPLRLHFSCDQYAELSIDGRLFARGPEASAIEAYAFSSFDIQDLAPGPHQLEVFAWWLGTKHFRSPLARETRDPGFILAATPPFADRLNTGAAPWRVTRLQSHYPDTDRDFPPAFGIGGGIVIDTRIPLPNPVPVHVVRSALSDNPCGEQRPHYCLRPARLPEQMLDPCSPGRVRAVVDTQVEANDVEKGLYAFREEDQHHPELELWRKAWSTGTATILPPHSQISVLIDLEDYYCGFPELTVSGGADAEINWDWAESLWVHASGKGDKGHRDEIVGKHFRGFSDTFFCNGKDHVLRPHWWRAGRYCLLRIRTAADPLTLRRARILETRYPLEIAGTFTCDQDASLNPVKALCLRGLQMCMHETYMDCPHYEQLMYVFDTRLEILTTYAVSPDDRLPRRAIELFDDSRRRFDGLTCSRFPCMKNQLIPLFSLCWTWMLRDYLYWRDDADWLRRFLPGARGVHDRFEMYENEDGLLAQLPGWCYGDWVKGWPHGNMPSAAEGVSCILNLTYVHSLLNLADLEKQLGDPLRAEPLKQKARRIQQRLRTRFWNAEQGVFMDDDSGKLSQHAQIWAILSQTLTGGEATRALHQALNDPAFVPASYMQRSHLFDALVAIGEGGRILDELQAWTEMINLGARTGFEDDEPTRSDCHAWSSHPLYHLPASLLGIQPAAPGFRQVRIAPQPGALREMAASVPHPQGLIRVHLHFKDGSCQGEVNLPGDCTGVLIWNGHQQPLNSGLQVI
jgi:hypothetical protein